MSDLANKEIKTHDTRRRLWPPIWLWIVVLSSWVVGAYFQLNAATMDFAIAFIVTWASITLTTICVFVWFVAFSGHSRRIRMTVLSSVLLLQVAFWTAFKIDHIWGEMYPSFTFRFGEDRDATLAKPTPGQQKADLATTTPQDFPEFLGPGRKNHLPDKSLSAWKEKPPREIWRQEIGAGWSGFAAVNGFAVTLEQRGEVEWTSCYRIEDGKLLWASGYEARHKTILGGIGPRSTPLIYEGRVYSLGATGHLACLAGSDGAVIWEKDLVELAGSDTDSDEKVVFWGRAGSPLAAGGHIIVPLGGPPGGPFASLAAFDPLSGELNWKGGDRQISYSSPVAAKIQGQDQVLIVNEDNVSGHQLDDGALLWSFNWPGNSTQDANASQAHHVGNNQVLITKGYGGGVALFEIRLDDRPDSKWVPRELWRNRRVMKTKFTNVVVRDGYIYGLSDGILECVDLKTGERQWKKGRYGQGQVLGVGKQLLVQAEVGDVYLLAVSPFGAEELGKLEALDDKTWNNLCLYGNRLLVRNSQEAACYEIVNSEQ